MAASCVLPRALQPELWPTGSPTTSIVIRSTLCGLTQRFLRELTTVIVLCA